MTEYVALLRGVNVGGVTIRSDDLRALFAARGFERARTFLASGNVRFEADGAEPAAVKERIERALGERFGYDAWIALTTPDVLRAAIAAYPFDAADGSRHPYLVFCADDGVRDALLARCIELPRGEDRVAPGPGVVFWSVPTGHTVDSPFGKELGRARWRRATTTRNLRTVSKIVA